MEPLVALGSPLRLLVLWAGAALLFAAGINVFLRCAVAPLTRHWRDCTVISPGFRGSWDWVG